MIVWVIYDIVSNKTRNKVIKISKNIGLYRVQKSVFLGEINKNEFDELKLRLEAEVDLDKDSVYVFSMSRQELDMAGLIGKAFDKELITDEIRELFF